MVVVAPGFDLFPECSPVGLTGFFWHWLKAFSAQSLTALCPSRTLGRKGFFFHFFLFLFLFFSFQFFPFFFFFFSF